MHQDVFVDDYDFKISADIYLDRLILILIINALLDLCLIGGHVEFQGVNTSINFDDF